MAPRVGDILRTLNENFERDNFFRISQDILEEELFLVDYFVDRKYRGICLSNV